ncbi:hypothetical protein [Photobacterium damselae]
MKLTKLQLEAIIKRKETLGISYRKQALMLEMNEKTLSRQINNYKRESKC